MSTATIPYEDEWGEIVDRPAQYVIELRWFDSTADMSSDSFNRWLARFATEIERTGRTRALVDATRFGMPKERMDGGWRDENIIPRYNAAGVSKFAFLMLPPMPLIGEPPRNEGPAGFPTAYFGSRASALTWLTEED